MSVNCLHTLICFVAVDLLICVGTCACWRTSIARSRAEYTSQAKSDHKYQTFEQKNIGGMSLSDLDLLIKCHRNLYSKSFISSMIFRMQASRRLKVHRAERLTQKQILSTLQNLVDEAQEKLAEVRQVDTDLRKDRDDISRRESELDEEIERFGAAKSRLKVREQRVIEREAKLEDKELRLVNREGDLVEREMAVKNREIKMQYASSIMASLNDLVAATDSTVQDDLYARLERAGL